MENWILKDGYLQLEHTPKAYAPSYIDYNAFSYVEGPMNKGNELVKDNQALFLSLMDYQLKVSPDKRYAMVTAKGHAQQHTDFFSQNIWITPLFSKTGTFEFITHPETQETLIMATGPRCPTIYDTKGTLITTVCPNYTGRGMTVKVNEDFTYTWGGGGGGAPYDVITLYRTIDLVKGGSGVGCIYMDDYIDKFDDLMIEFDKEAGQLVAKVYKSQNEVSIYRYSLEEVYEQNKKGLRVAQLIHKSRNPGKYKSQDNILKRWLTGQSTEAVQLEKDPELKVADEEVTAISYCEADSLDEAYDIDEDRIYDYAFHNDLSRLLDLNPDQFQPKDIAEALGTSSSPYMIIDLHRKDKPNVVFQIESQTVPIKVKIYERIVSSSA